MFEETHEKKRKKRKDLSIIIIIIRFNGNKNRTNRVIKSIVIESIPRQNLVLPCLVRG